MDGDIQATFNHTIRKTSFMDPNPSHFAMTGFGNRAIKINTNELFKCTPATRRVPDFKQLLKCQTREKIMALPLGEDATNVDFYAILPPCLTQELFNKDNFSPTHILLKFISKINQMHATTTTTNDTPGDTSEDVTTPPDNADDNNTDSSPTNVTQTQTTTESSTNDTSTTENEVDDVTPHPMQPAFRRVLNFLFECIKSPRVIEAVPTQICNTPAAETWLDREHNTSLKQGNSAPTMTTINHDQPSNNLLLQMGQLTAGMVQRQLSAIETTKLHSSSNTDSSSKYNNLPSIIKNIVALCTMEPGIHQADLDEIEPTDNLRSFIGIKSGTSTINSTLQHALRSKGCIAYLQNGMSNDIKNGIIASSPDPFERNGLCVFLTAPGELKQVKADRKAELEEKSARNKLSAEAITLLTTNEAYLPRDFWAFEHMVRNFIELVSYLLGPECLIARAWRQIMDRAQKKQMIYKRFE